MKITKEYSNPNNNGKERVSKDNGKFYIQSFVNGAWLDAVQVNRSQVESCMLYTKAPKDIIDSILN